MLKMTAKSNINRVLLRVKNLKRNYDEALRSALGKAGDFMVNSMKKGFVQSKDPKGKAWEPLNPAKYPFRPMEDGVIREGKRPVEAGAKPLINYGHMMGSLTFEFLGENKIRIGYGTPEDAEKGYRHQFGVAGFVEKENLAGKRYREMITPWIRAQIGFAKWARFGAMNDKATILKIYKLELEQVGAK